MPIRWWYAPTLPATGECLALPEEEARHVKVLRLQAGEEAHLYDGAGTVARVQLQDPREGLWHVLASEVHPPPPQRMVWIPWLQGQKMDWTVEKCIELGVSRVVLFRAERSQCPAPRKERLAKIIRAATKQSGQAWEATLEICSSLPTEPTAPLFYGSLEPAAHLPQHSLASSSFIWTCGPEGGWSPKEEKLLLRIGTPLKLSTHLLRAETALVCGYGVLTALALGLPEKEEGAHKSSEDRRREDEP